MKKSKYIYAIALCLFISGISYLVYTAVAENSVYFLNVSEALAAPADKTKSARLFGTVAEQDLIKDEDGLGVRFVLIDKDDSTSSLVVDYKGVIPDTFQAGAEVIVEGGLQEKTVFKAVSLMTKCPSKYEKQNRQS